MIVGFPSQWFLLKVSGWCILEPLSKDLSETPCIYTHSRFKTIWSPVNNELPYHWPARQLQPALTWTLQVLIRLPGDRLYHMFKQRSSKSEILRFSGIWALSCRSITSQMCLNGLRSGKLDGQDINSGWLHFRLY